MKRLIVIFFSLFLSMGIILAQTRNIGGTVIDEADEPLPGVTVFIKGTTVAVITDIDGKFTIKVPQNVKILSFSYVGYDSQEVSVAENMKVAMKPSKASQLSEVVVIGMTTMDKRLFTGATDKLNNEDIKLDGLPEISRALEGRSAGVSVQNVSGTFGTAPKISIRGATSIYGDSKPLWVVDGVIMEDVVQVSTDALSSGDATTLISSAIAGLNADDIESFQILKDGSATSIYGARAMAGVIVVQTKKGRAGSSSISYTGEFTSRLVPNYNDFNIMNSQEQMGVYRELYQKGWLNFAESYRRSTSGVYGKMYELLNTYDPAIGTFALMNTPEARNAYLRSAEMRNTDWFGELFSANISQMHSVSISSGTDKTTFYASLSAMLDPGWYKRGKVNRYTGNLNVTHKILPNLSINMIAVPSYRKQEAPGTLSQDVDVVNGQVKRDFDINPYSYSMNTSRALEAGSFYTRNYAPFNIMHELENNYMDLSVVDFRVQGELKWNVLKGLELSTLGAIKYIGTSYEHYVKDNSNQAMAYRAMGDYTVQQANSYLYTDPDIPYSVPITVLPEGGFYIRRDYAMLGYDFNAKFRYTYESPDSKHIAGANGGMEINSTDRKSSSFTGPGMQYENGEIPFYIYQYFKKGQETGVDFYSKSINRIRTAAYFLLLSYNYDRRYTLNATIRYDGTNLLGRTKQARWLPTWNLAGGWTVSEEHFFDKLKDKISYMNLRLSYSLAGDRGPGLGSASVLIRSYNPYRPFASDKESALGISSLENSELTYEKKRELNIGLDLGFLGNRLNFTGDVYLRRMSDLIGQMNTQGIGGEVTKYANVASMKSSGFEFSISSKNIKTKDFTWNTDFIFGHVNTEITEFLTRSRIIDLVRSSGYNFAEGYAQRVIFSIPFAGLGSNGMPLFFDKDGNVITGANINLQNRENVLDYLKYEGTANPTVNGSFGNTFTYKNFRLNVFTTYAFGNKLRLDPVFRASYNDMMATPKEFKNRWVMPGDENYTNIPVIVSDREYANTSNISKIYNLYNYSDVRVAKGDFIRLKEVSLSYDFPSKWLGNSIKKLSLKLQATNLFLLYADKKLNGSDPEFYNSGGVAAPVPRQFTFSVRLGL